MTFIRSLEKPINIDLETVQLTFQKKILTKYKESSIAESPEDRIDYFSRIFFEYLYSLYSNEIIDHHPEHVSSCLRNVLKVIKNSQAIKLRGDNWFRSEIITIMNQVLSYLKYVQYTSNIDDMLIYYKNRGLEKKYINVLMRNDFYLVSQLQLLYAVDPSLTALMEKKGISTKLLPPIVKFIESHQTDS